MGNRASVYFPFHYLRHSEEIILPMSTAPTCVLGSFQWAFNSHSQSPCTVAQSLLGVCSGGSYNLLPLSTPGTVYLGPSIDGANPCQCSTVSYSMISACAACQNATITLWNEWATNCATVYIDSFPDPIPVGTSVPGWAYLDVETSNTFDPTVAKQNANLTESTAVPQPTTSSSSTSSTLTKPSTTSATSTQTSTSQDTTDSRSNVIGSGVVGGLVGLAAILACIAYLYFRQRRKIRTSSIEALEANSRSADLEEEKQVPALVVHPPVIPFYQNTEALSHGAYSDYASSGSEGSIAVINRRPQTIQRV